DGASSSGHQGAVASKGTRPSKVRCCNDPVQQRFMTRNQSLPVFEGKAKDATEARDPKDSDSLFQRRMQLTKARRISVGAWLYGPKVAQRPPLFEIEEQVLVAPSSVSLRVALGYRYAEHEGSKHWAVVLLEQASLMAEDPGGWRFWQVLGHMHYHLMLRYPRQHHCCIFHLHQAAVTYKKAMSYVENMGDVVLIIHFATALFMQGVKDRPLEMLATANLRHGIQFGPLDNQIYVDRLFTHFQICAANGRTSDSLALLAKIRALHAQPSGYSRTDMDLIHARCLQLDGELLASSELFSRLLKDMFGPATAYADELYADMWHHLGSLCLRQGHLYLAVEYTTLALTYAKHAKLRATLYYARGLAHYCLSDFNGAEDDYRRGRNSNHDVKPTLSLAELRRSYKEDFDLVLSTSIEDIVRAARKGMGKTTASLKVQRQFRQFLDRKRLGADPQSFTRRLLEKQTTRKALLPEPVAANLPQSVGTLPELELTPPPSHPPHVNALASLKLLHSATVHLSPFLPHAEPRKFKVAPKASRKPPRNFLSPDFDRPDARRQRSLASYRRLGYSNGDLTYGQHWRALLDVGLTLFKTPASLARSVAHVRAFHPSVAEAMAICTLVDSDGSVEEACGKLSDESYSIEIASLVQVIDVEAALARRWAASATEEDDNPLYPVPEIDPATGKFVLHDVRTLLAREEEVSVKRLANVGSVGGSFRTLHIIDDHVSSRRTSVKDVVVLK
ncbi:hypothetical protein ACHHYP_12820, partial [Achlya hypogyna]